MFHRDKRAEKLAARISLMLHPIPRRTIVIGGHKTSVSIEQPFWTGLKEIAASRQSTLSDLVSEIDMHRRAASLSSAIRLFVLQFYQEQARQRT